MKCMEKIKAIAIEIDDFLLLSWRKFVGFVSYPFTKRKENVQEMGYAPLDEDCTIQRSPDVVAEMERCFQEAPACREPDDSPFDIPDVPGVATDTSDLPQSVGTLSELSRKVSN